MTKTDAPAKNTEPLILHFVDTETTDIIDRNPDAEITEIAIVTWSSDEGKTNELLHAPLRIKKAPPADITKHNKSWDPAVNLAQETDSWQIAHSKEIAEMLKGAYICGSNPEFDKRMIAAECFRTGQPKPDWHWRGVNTASLGMMLWVMGDTPGCGLGHLTQFFGIEHKAHTALGDCYAAIAVWEAFFDLFIFRPRMMKEALEEIDHKIDKPGHNDFGLAAARQVALRGLVGE